MRSVNERRCNLTSPFIGWTHAQNDPWINNNQNVLWWHCIYKYNLPSIISDQLPWDYSEKKIAKKIYQGYSMRIVRVFVWGNGRLVFFFFNLSIYLFIYIFIHFVKCKQNFDTLFSLSTGLGNGLVYYKGSENQRPGQQFPSLCHGTSQQDSICCMALQWRHVCVMASQNTGNSTICPIIWSMYLVHAQTHLGQVGKWPWRCTTTGLDNSMESQTKIICPVILEICVPQCLEFTGPRWTPRTKASDAELWCFLWSRPE